MSEEKEIYPAGEPGMREELITAHFEAAFDATITAELEEALAVARTEFTELEYEALLEKLFHAGGSPSELETVISQTITFGDGSRIRIEVDAPARADEAQATEAYNNHILRGIQEIEIERTTSDSLL
jgi:hypothetical protein